MLTKQLYLQLGKKVCCNIQLHTYTRVARFLIHRSLEKLTIDKYIVLTDTGCHLGDFPETIITTPNYLQWNFFMNQFTGTGNYQVYKQVLDPDWSFR